MVRGYPNFKMDFLSDQDSRHSQVITDLDILVVLQLTLGIYKIIFFLILKENGPQDKYHSLRSRSTRKSRCRDVMEASHEKTTRHNGEVSGRREVKKNMKYIYDFETTEVRTRRLSVRGQSDGQENPEAEDSNDKEEKKNRMIEEESPRNRMSRRTRTKEVTESSEHVNGEEKEAMVNGDIESKTEEIKEKEEINKGIFFLKILHSCFY